MLTACLILLACTFATSAALLGVVARQLRHPMVNVYNQPAPAPVSAEQVFNIAYPAEQSADVAKQIARRLACMP
jgi:hypothetical protein